jgi:PAS domain S-box-containing protein
MATGGGAMAKRQGDKKPKTTLAKESTRSPRKRNSVGENQLIEDQFRSMVDAIRDYAIYMLDPDGRIMTWNIGAQRLKGYSEVEAIGMNYSAFFTKDAIAAGKPKRELEQAKLEGRFEEEGWRVRKIGPQFWANVLLTPIYTKGILRGYVKVTRDLTERKAAEDALRQSEEWLRTTLQSIGDAVIATDIAGDVKFVNPAAESLTGWTQTEAQGKPLNAVFVIVNEQTRKPVTNPFFKVVSSGRVVGLANHTVLIARDGTEHPIADSAAPILNSGNDIVGVVVVFRRATKSSLSEAE